MLRVNGLKKPFNEKTKEVRAANLRAASNLNRAQFDVNKNDMLTRDIIYSQAAANLQVKKDLEAAQQRVVELKGELKATKVELGKLQDIDRDTSSLRRQVENLRKKLANQEEQLRSKFEERAKDEKRWLIEENEADCVTRMKMAWKALFPNDDYSIWEYRYEQATGALDQQQQEADEGALGDETGGQDHEPAEDHPTNDGDMVDENEA